MKLFDTTLARLQSSLDLRLVRQNVLAGNLANVDTPSYQPKDLDFDAALKTAETPSAGPAVGLAAAPAAEGHIPLGGAPAPATDPSRFVQVASTLGGLDGNGVDLDRTMVELSKNALQYGAAAKAAGKKLAILRYVASDGVG